MDVRQFSRRGGEDEIRCRDRTALARCSQRSGGAAFLGLLGLTDVEFVYAEGLAIAEQTKAQAVADARAAIERLVPVRLAA